jgi:hypothetical protein
MKSSFWKSLVSGAAGAAALTILHETARRKIDEAPHVHKFGMRGISKGLQLLGRKEPQREQLFRWALVGDLLSNAIYYSAVGKGDSKSVWWRGALLGLSAGIGAVVLPKPLGLGEAPSNRTRATQIMTIAWYLIGGLTAAATSKTLGNSDE